jgi:hypothetical protein
MSGCGERTKARHCGLRQARRTRPSAQPATPDDAVQTRTPARGAPRRHVGLCVHAIGRSRGRTSKWPIPGHCCGAAHHLLADRVTVFANAWLALACSVFLGYMILRPLFDQSPAQALGKVIAIALPAPLDVHPCPDTSHLPSRRDDGRSDSSRRSVPLLDFPMTSHRRSPWRTSVETTPAA